MIAPLLVSLAVAASPAGSTRPGAPAEPVIVAIEIEGNRRTSPAFVRSVMGVAPGQVFDLATLPALEHRLLNLGIFRSVRVSAEEGAAGTILRVDVREKRTLVPIPVLAASSGVVTFGAVLLDSDVLGEGKQLGAGALASNRGWSAFAAFRDPAVAFTRWTAAIRARAGRGRQEQFQDGSLVYRFQDARLEAGASGGYRLGGGWAVEAGWVERREEARASEGFAPPPRAGPVHGPGLAVDLDATDREDYLRVGLSGRVELRQGLRLAPGDRAVGQAWSTVTWSGHGFRDHGITVEVSLDEVRGDPVLDAVRLGGATGSRGFPAEGLWAEQAARLALEYQVPFWRPTWGVLTAVALCDAGAIRWRAQGREYAAPGAGVRLFLRNIAIPVVGIDVAWATGASSPQASVQLGFRW